jgi:hypothetical protein
VRLNVQETEKKKTTRRRKGSGRYTDYEKKKRNKWTVVSDQKSSKAKMELCTVSVVLSFRKREQKKTNDSKTYLEKKRKRNEIRER